MLIVAGAAQARTRHHYHHYLFHGKNTAISTTCTGSMGGTEFTGNLTVPPNAFCDLEDAVVDGNVYVDQGADFFAGGDWFKRNLSSEAADSVTVIYTTVNGNAGFDATTGFNQWCDYYTSLCLGFNDYTGGNANPNGKRTKFGNLSITNTNPFAAEVGYIGVVNNLSCSGNAYVYEFGPVYVGGHESGQCAGF